MLQDKNDSRQVRFFELLRDKAVQVKQVTENSFKFSVLIDHEWQEVGTFSIANNLLFFGRVYVWAQSYKAIIESAFNASLNP